MESEITPAAPRPRGRPARPEHEANDAALAAATWLLLNEGYAATTMEAVARRAGLAKKTLYRFAANREDLVPWWCAAGPTVSALPCRPMRDRPQRWRQRWPRSCA